MSVNVKTLVPTQQGTSTTQQSSIDISLDCQPTLPFVTKAVAFLQQNSLLEEEDYVAPCHCCDREIKETHRNRRNGKIHATLP